MAILKFYMAWVLFQNYVPRGIFVPDLWLYHYINHYIKDCYNYLLHYFCRSWKNTHIHIYIQVHVYRVKAKLSMGDNGNDDYLL